MRRSFLLFLTGCSAFAQGPADPPPILEIVQKPSTLPRP
jgi:hypothetical protein